MSRKAVEGHLYMLKPEDKEVLFQGLRFIKFKEEKEEMKLSKTKIILEFLRKNEGKAFLQGDN